VLIINGDRVPRNKQRRSAFGWLLAKAFSLFFTAALQCPTRESEDKDWKGGVIDFPEIPYTIQPSFSILPCPAL